MSSTFFWSWISIQLLLILYVNYKSKSVINAFTLSTIVYFGSYAYPYLYVLGYTETLFNESLFYSDFASSAIWSYFWFKSSLDFAYFLMANFYQKRNNIIHYNDVSEVLKLEKITRLYKMIGGGVVLTLYFLSFIMFIIGAGGINEFLFPVSRFNFSNEKIVNLAYIISLLTYFYSLLRHYNYRKNHVLVIFGMLYVLIYPMSLSGRAVVLPFVMMIIAAYFSDNGLGKLKLLFLFSLISAFYINALYVRNNGVGIDNFIIGFVTTYEDIPFLFDFFFATVSGFATTTVTHSGLFDGTIDVIPNPILFLIYISPIPSLFLPTELFVPYQSLTPHFGFSIGINSDIVSESMLWFGMNGVIFIGFILGWVTRYVDWRTLSKDMIAKLIFFSYTYLILMSNIASMRASSRFIILFLTFILLRWILIKFTRITKGS